MPPPHTEVHVASMTIALPLFLIGGFLFLWLARRASLRGLRETAALRMLEGNPGRTVFLAHLAGHGLSPEDSESIYRYFQGSLPRGIDGFPVELDDELGRTIGICGPDVDDAARDIAGLCHCKVPTNAVFNQDQTVREMLDAVLAARRPGKAWWSDEPEAGDQMPGTENRGADGT